MSSLIFIICSRLCYCYSHKIQWLNKESSITLQVKSVITIASETVCISQPASILHCAHSHTVLPSYTALKPCALTAKSVVNHKANIDPLLTIGEGSMNPDNLENTKKYFKKCISETQQDNWLLTYKSKQWGDIKCENKQISKYDSKTQCWCCG